jgi:hypothetical protein
LQSFFEDGWGTFVKHGHITRLDVAVNIPTVLIDQFQIMSQQSVSTIKWSKDGKLTGYAHGKKNGNQTLLYDRKEKRVSQKKSWKGKEGARLERRFVGCRCHCPPSTTCPTPLKLSSWWAFPTPLRANR